MEEVGPPPKLPSSKRGGSSGRLAIAKVQKPGAAVSTIRGRLLEKGISNLQSQQQPKKDFVPPPPKVQSHSFQNRQSRSTKTSGGTPDPTSSSIPEVDSGFDSDTFQSYKKPNKSWVTEKKTLSNNSRDAEEESQHITESDLSLEELDEEAAYLRQKQYRRDEEAKESVYHSEVESDREDNPQQNRYQQPRSHEDEEDISIWYNDMLESLRPNGYTGRVVATKEDIRKLVFTPVPELTTLRCRVERSLSREGNPMYLFVVPISSEGSLHGNSKRGKEQNLTLMLAKRRTKLWSGIQDFTPAKTTYVISMNEEDFHVSYAARSERYFGKLQLRRSMVLEGFVYLLYDNGFNSEHVESKSKRRGSAFGRLRNWLQQDIGELSNENGDDATEFQASNPRKEYAAIRLPSKSLSLHPNEMFIALPPVSAASSLPCDSVEGHECIEEIVNKPAETLATAPSTDEDSLVDTFHVYGIPDDPNGKLGPMMYTVPGSRKRPMVSHRVNLPVAPSTKNCDIACQISEDTQVPRVALNENGKYISFSMGRLGQDRFELVVGYPLSPYQAFGIALARLDAMSNVRRKVSSYLS